MTSYTDTQVNTGQTYYYLVSALHGSQTAIDSNEATASTNRRMNLQVPIEMIDQPLSSDLTTITFERSRTSLDTTAYDGTITYDIEIVGQNTDTTNAYLELVGEDCNNPIPYEQYAAMYKQFGRAVS